ncbi:MAG TPA: class I SAM-dependent methyltransferase [Pirellulales bacterium]|nr:class I SAM-dependent methyltransferase [Pirellulales bacterium]
MAESSSRPDWRLPRGVTRALAEHAQLSDVALAYDERFSVGDGGELDEKILNKYVQPPGLVVDLGSGAGRLAVPLARRGLRVVAVDLSRPALKALRARSDLDGLSIECLVANLVELDALRDGTADYCISMFSTLGMIRGHENRRQFLRHVRRILRPGGRFVLHVHNRWYHLWQQQSRGWFLRNLFQSLTRRDVEAGDKYFTYHGVPNMFVHAFTRRELLSDLRSASLRVETLIPLSIERRHPLKMPWLLGSIRAGGWIAVCKRR